MTVRTASTLRWALKIAITILFVVMVNRGLTRQQIQLLGDHLALLPVVAAVAAGVLSLLFQLLRWRGILATTALSNGFLPALKTFLWGHLLAFVTPGRIGEFGRALALDPARKADAVAAVVVDKVFGVVATALFGAIGMIVQYGAFGTMPPRRLSFFMVPGCVGLLFLFAAVRIWARYRPTGKGRIVAAFSRLWGILGMLRGLPLGRQALWSILAQLALCVQTALILRLFGSADWGANMVIAAEVYAFMLFLPFFIANIGLREYSFIMAFETARPVFDNGLAFGTVALGVSLLILIMNILLPAAAGLCVMMVDQKHKSTI